MNNIIDKCPICKSNLVVTHLYCPNCRTGLEGRFELPFSPFSKLDKEQLEFVLTFIRCDGKFNRMEEELALSYPTLRSRFNEILRIMGFDAEKEELVSLSTEERRQILDDLDKGQISLEEAEQLLKGEKQLKKDKA